MITETKSLLDSETHARLIADLSHVCETANVPAHYIHNSMVGVSSATEIDWVKKFHANRAAGLAGVAMIGLDSAETRMMAMCGALLRNFIDARIVPVNSLLMQIKKGVTPDATVLFIPNLFIGEGNGIAKWDVQVLYEFLLSRLNANKPTVLYIDDMATLKKAYGPIFASHIKAHYQLIEG